MELRAPVVRSGPSWGLVAALCGGSLLVGGVVGFLLGVLSVQEARSFAGSLFDEERAADVAAPQTWDRPAFALQFPGNWKVDRADPDHDPDHMITLESPGSSMAMLIVADGELDPASVLAQQESAFVDKLLKNPTRAPFTTWSRFTGSGVTLRGRMLGLYAATVRVFAFRAGGRCFTLVEQVADEDRALVGPGLELLERSFRVKDAPATPPEADARPEADILGE